MTLAWMMALKAGIIQNTRGLLQVNNQEKESPPFFDAKQSRRHEKIYFQEIQNCKFECALSKPSQYWMHSVLDVDVDTNTKSDSQCTRFSDIIYMAQRYNTILLLQVYIVHLDYDSVYVIYAQCIHNFTSHQ